MAVEGNSDLAPIASSASHRSAVMSHIASRYRSSSKSGNKIQIAQVYTECRNLYTAPFRCNCTHCPSPQQYRTPIVTMYKVLLQLPLLPNLLVRLDLVTDLEPFPSLKTHTTLGTLAHLRNVFFDILERGDNTCRWPKVSKNIPNTATAGHR